MSTSFGRIVAFDEEMGLGELIAADGTRLQFHCVELLDGSRTISVGASVTFTVSSKLGRYEASAIRRS